MLNGEQSSSGWSEHEDNLKIIFTIRFVIFVAIALIAIGIFASIIDGIRNARRK